MSESLLCDPMGRPLDERGNVIYPKLPLATYFVNAGLSERDAFQLEAHVFATVRQMIAAKARTDDVFARRRYLVDPQYRMQVNMDVIAEVLLSIGFSREELRVIDLGTQLGLAPEAPAPMRVDVTGVDGREQTFDVEDLDTPGPDGKCTLLTDVHTGEKQLV